MVALVDSGVWDWDTLLNVVSYQVWQYSEGLHGLMAERVLQTLLKELPEDPSLLFYLAELYHRRGDLESADATYRQVLEVDQQYSQVHLRLGMLAEASCESQGASCAGMGESAEWYRQYFDLVPEDVLALKRLAEVCTTLEQGRLENESCREAAERFSRARHQIPESGGNGDSASGELVFVDPRARSRDLLCCNTA